MSGICSAAYKCTITVSGSLEDLLVDGNSYSAAMTLSAWCDNGHCYGSADIPVTATAPFTITCDKLTGTKVCSATISGAASAIFSNGRDLGEYPIRTSTRRELTPMLQNFGAGSLLKVTARMVSVRLRFRHMVIPCINECSWRCSGKSRC